MQAPRGDQAIDEPDWLVACLCAQWCTVCRGWQPEFARLAAQCAGLLPRARWLWVDVEAQADALGDFEPEDFPVLAVQRGADLLYCSVLPQQPARWQRLIASLAEASAGQPARREQPPRVPGLDLRRLHDDSPSAA